MNYSASDRPQDGAPDWIVTFADLMILLLCFFILLLSFSETNKKKFRDIAGSLEKAFGVQRKKPDIGKPLGQKMIARDFDQQIIQKKIREELAQIIRNEISSRFKNESGLMQVETTGEEIIIRLMGETTFDSGKALIKENMKPLLLKVGALLKDADGYVIICGHTDNVPIAGGPYKSNLVLSMARSAAVAEFLIEKARIAPKRISTMGFGEHNPLASNDTPEGRRQNRRVEIILSDSRHYTP